MEPRYGEKRRLKKRYKWSSNGRGTEVFSSCFYVIESEHDTLLGVKKLANLYTVLLALIIEKWFSHCLGMLLLIRKNI